MTMQTDQFSPNINTVILGGLTILISVTGFFIREWMDRLQAGQDRIETKIERFQSKLAVIEYVIKSEERWKAKERETAAAE